MTQMRLSSRMLVAGASMAMIVVLFVPVWSIYLTAPQYPEGLEMNIWLSKLTGQVEIINNLNHYIGMKHINADMFPEFSYMKYILLGYIAFGVFVALIGNRKLLLSLLFITVGIAGAAIYDFYKWGYDYGHNLDPGAAIKIPGLSYQPPVIGHKTVLNFDAYSYPDTGGWIIIVAGAIFFLVYILEWRKKGMASTKRTTNVAQAKFASAACMILFLSACTVNPEPFAYGKDLCEDCKMTIIEPRFGAQIITKKGRVFKYDDIHCVANTIKKQKITSSDIKQIVFVDYNKENVFLESTNAFFVVSAQLESPMNSNAAAFHTKDVADKKAAEIKGSVKTWSNLLQEL